MAAKLHHVDYDTAEVGMWVLNVSEEYTASIYTVS
jgi:hypothetical protein